MCFVADDEDDRIRKGMEAAAEAAKRLKAAIDAFGENSIIKMPPPPPPS